MITVEVSEDYKTGDKIIKAIVPSQDLMGIKLDNLDKAVLNQPEECAADVFQSLELLARRQMEQLTTMDKKG